MFDFTLAEFGDVDIVCPGAGVYEPHWSNFWHPPGSPESKDAADGDPGHYATLDINLMHPIRATQLALSHWLHPRPVSGASADEIPAPASPTNPKRIVHISSIAGQVPVFTAPLYGASKFAITGFVRSLAPLEAGKGVRVNAVAPGVVKTPLWTEHPEKLVSVDETRDAWVTPDEVAEAMLKCVEEREHVGGTILEVGRNTARHVGVFNDPGPSRDPKDGCSPSDSAKGEEMVWSWLEQESVWGTKGSKA